jgi:hypothetical protein
MYKPFCPVLFKENNKPGIDTAVGFLKSFGCENVGNNVEAYCSHDCIVSYKGKRFKVEAEKSNVWKDSNERQFDITVPERKHKSLSDIYIMCNYDMSALIVTKMSYVKQAPVKTKWVTTSQMNEPFFYVPYTKFDYYKKVGKDWICMGNNANIMENCGVKPPAISFRANDIRFYLKNTAITV